jgi:hypothetical protein
MFATIVITTTVVAIKTREPQSALASWVLRLGPPPLLLVRVIITGRDITGAATATTATRIVATTTIRIEDRAKAPRYAALSK